MSVKQNRDPRRKPVAGDVVVSADRSVRKRVDRIKAGVVTYTWSTRFPNDSGSSRCKVESWQRWCRDREAKVLERAAI
jgi:hypothetical protein